MASFSVRYVHMTALRSAGQVTAVEVPDLLPAVHGCIRPVRGPVHGEEGVPGAGVAVELVRLPGLGEDLVQFANLVRRGAGVVVAEQAEQRAGQVLGEMHYRAGLERHARRRRADDERAVTVDRRVQGQAARREEGLAAAGAVADRS